MKANARAPAAQLQVWVSQLASPTGTLADFQQYLDVIQVTAEDSSESEYEPPPEPAPKVQRRVVTKVEPGDNEELNVGKQCAICCERPTKTIFTNCGHMLCCVECSLKCSSCPVCRVAVDGNIVRVYAA